jgi:hypothetical protein
MHGGKEIAMPFTVKEAKEALKNMKHLSPANPRMDDDLELSLLEVIFFMAPDLIQKTRRGFTIKELAKGLADQKIEIKPGTLNRYLNEFQGVKAEPRPKKAKPVKKADSAAGKIEAESDSPKISRERPPITPEKESGTSGHHHQALNQPGQRAAYSSDKNQSHPYPQ